MGWIVICARQFGISCSPVLNAKSIHDESIHKEVDFSANQLVGLEFVEFIQQEQFSPSISVLLTSLQSSSCFVVLLLFIIIFANHSTLVCELVLHSCLLLCYSCSIIVLWAFPVNQENVSGALFKVDFVNACHKFGTNNPSKHPGEILVWENVVKVW